MSIVALVLFHVLAFGRPVRWGRALLAFALCLSLSGWARGCRRLPDSPPRRIHSLAKAPWVKQEVIRLKALMREAGTCRAIADCFNRRFGERRKMTVGRTFVNETIRRHRYEIEVLRRRIKNAKPKPVPRNLVWGMDLTGKTTLDGTTRAVLAIVEHASRAALRLEALQSKSSWALVARLVDAIKHHGKPKAVRTDNESVFTSRAFRLALFLLGIRHQRTDPGWSSSAAELPRRALTEPYVTVSRHTALVEAWPLNKWLDNAHRLLPLARLACVCCRFDRFPLLHGHYSASTLLRNLPSLCRASVLWRLRGSLACASPFASRRQVLTFLVGACAMVMPPLCRMPTGQSPDFRQSCPAGQGFPAVLTSSNLFRHLIGDSLSFISIART
jgi:transposase InsO family protein